MRKLTVKNFSVIKDAELEFGKITVLIGPQASGKSLLCKLAYFFEQVVPEIATSHLLLRMLLPSLNQALQMEFESRFPQYAWGEKNFELFYHGDYFHLSIDGHENPIAPLRVVFDPEFSSAYMDWINSHSGEGSAKGLIDSLQRGQSVPDSPMPVVQSLYIPTGRAFFSTPNKGFASFGMKNLDWITQRFATEIDWDYKALRQAAETSSSFLTIFGIQASGILRGRVVNSYGELFFESSNDSRKLPFHLLSSGTSELLPLLNPLSQRVSHASIGSELDKTLSQPTSSNVIFIEEPELSVFPDTQYALVRLFGWLANEQKLGLSFVITTHSPYVLSAFNNLLEAWETGHADDGRAELVRKVIEEKYWVDPAAFKAYAMKDGISQSIIAEDTGLISGNYLDSVSETIGAEFDELLRIGYVDA